MRIPARAVVIAASVLVVAAAGLIACSSDPEAKPKARAKVLVFSKTAGFRHDSIPAGIAAIRSLGRANGFSVTATENAKAFTVKRLRDFDAVIFLSTTGDVLAPRQQKAFRSYIKRGGGWVGVHSAADTEYDWPFYGGLLGAYFLSHPAIQPAAIDVTDRSHPSTKPLPARWTRTDEWYDFRSNPRGTVHVLATLDESTYSGGTMGADHPIAWCHRFKGGRAWYTAGGHTIESYSEPDFRRHLLGGILWAAGIAKGSCRV
jgi:type 1 glutamine amidotransferase